MNIHIGSAAATAEGLAAARTFLDEVLRIDQARLDSNPNASARAAAISATAVQFVLGAMLNEHGSKHAAGILSGLGLGAASTVGQYGGVETLNAALGLVLEGYEEGANRTLVAFTPKGSA